ncbi:MAG: hypothetical protein O3C21_01520 [Verrucomicrobia bacterium]|nr:hypothetical protein [Verrucomicrobiota bacterium]
MGFRARALAKIRVLIPAPLVACQGVLFLLFTFRWVGGDFNSPAGDRAYFSLSDDYSDSFHPSGKGEK